MPNPFCQIMVAKKLDDIKTKKVVEKSKLDKNKVKSDNSETNNPNKNTTKQ